MTVATLSDLDVRAPGNHIAALYAGFQHYEKYLLAACAGVAVALLAGWAIRAA